MPSYTLNAFTRFCEVAAGVARRVPLYARALPLDWLTAGSAGALLGYWLSARVHELKLLEKLQERLNGDSHE